MIKALTVLVAVLSINNLNNKQMGSEDQNTIKFLTYTDTDNIQHSIEISDIAATTFKDNILQFQTKTPFRVPVFGKKQEFLRYTDNWPLHIVTKFDEIVQFSKVIGFIMEEIETIETTEENPQIDFNTFSV